MNDHSDGVRGGTSEPQLNTSGGRPPAVRSLAGRGWLIAGGVLLLAGVVLCVVPNLTAASAWWWRPLGAALTLAGAWAGGRCFRDQLRLVGLAVAFVAAALAVGVQWWWLGFAAGGAAGGFLCAWGYAKGHRARWLSVALLLAVYLGTALAGLVRIASGGTMWWSFAHGLVTVALGVGLMLWSGGGSGPRRTRALKIGRLAILLALALPYVALALLGLREG